VAGEPCARRDVLWKSAANLLSASRFLLAAVWLGAYASGNRRPALMGPIALAAAMSDFVDGRLARRRGCVDKFGRWLDAVADIVFVLTALSCEARAGSIPAYIPVLIALSFIQYAIDSVVILGFATPVASRFGHWGGIINFVLVITLACAPPPRLPGQMVRRAAPVIAIFYLAAIIERALNYPPSRLPRPPRIP
jgi:phosphatidylglycerophosphate synthase